MVTKTRDPSLKSTTDQVNRVMKLAREYLKTPSPYGRRPLGSARSSSPSQRRGFHRESPKRKKAVGDEDVENKKPKNEVAINYASGKSALFALSSSSYSSAAMGDIINRWVCRNRRRRALGGGQ